MRLIKILPIAATALLALPGAAMAKDRNHDGIPDGWEQAHHLSLKVNQANRDQDHDGLKNRGEFRAGTNPRRADSDGDGVPDGQENAGKVTSFANGVLTIALFDNSTLTGAVTPGTKIECKGGSAQAARHGDDNGQANDNGQGDASGQGDANDANDDHGDGPGDNADQNATGCTPAVGDTVRQAEIRVTSTGNVFKEVELAK